MRPGLSDAKMFDPTGLPFVPLPGGIESLDDLMAFDRKTCETHKRFVRPIHPHDAPPGAGLAGIVGFSRVLVNEIEPGVRSRFPLSCWN